jgi:DNA-binding FrmR family transcriptional regulator
MTDVTNELIDQKRKSLITRLKRVEGQLRGVQTLVSEEQDCEKIAQQLSAARKALDKSFYEAIACMIEQELGGEREVTEKYTRLLAKYG